MESLLLDRDWLVKAFTNALCRESTAGLNTVVSFPELNGRETRDAVCCLFLSAVTPSDRACRVPREFMAGEAGFSLLFPAMEGVHIRPFHFCKKSLSDSALEKAGNAGSHPEQAPAHGRFVDPTDLNI